MKKPVGQTDKTRRNDRTSVDMNSTERKRLDEVLRQSEKKHRELFNNAAVGIFRSKIDGSAILAANRKLCEIFGYTEEEFIGNPAHIRWADSGARDRMLAELREKGSLHDYEIDIRTKNGGVRTVSVSIQFYPEHGYLEGSAIDITERKHFEELLRESEAKFRQLAESVPQLIWTCRGDGPCDYLNPQWLEYTGIPEAEQLGYGWLNQLHPNDRDRTVAAWNAAVETNKPFDVEFRIRRKDGIYRWFKTRATAVRDGEGRIVKWYGTNTDVEDQKRADEALRASEARYRSYVDATGQIAWITSTDGEIVEDVPSLRKFSGQTYEEAKGSGWAKTIHPDDLERTLQVWNTAVATQSNYEIEYRMRRHDGVYRHLLARSFPIFGEDGSIREWVGTCIDITDRKRAEETLRESLDRFEFANRATFNAIWDWNLRTNELGWNENFQLLFGYRADEIEPGIESWTNRIHPEDLDRVSRSIHLAIDSGKQFWSDHYRFRRKDGSYADVEDRGYISRETSGTPIRMIGAMQDVTESKRAEEKLRESEAKYRTLVENIPQKIFMKDRKFRWISINEKLAQDLGIRPEEVVGKMDADLFLPELATKYHADDVRIMETGKTEELEERYVQEGREIWVNTIKTPVRNNNGEIVGVMGVFWDITERKRAEESIREANDNLERRVLERTLELAKSRQLLDQSGKLARVGGWEIDLKTNTLTWTDIVYEIHEVERGFKPTLEGGINFYAPEAVPVISEAVRLTMEEGRPYDLELELITAKKNRIWVRAIGQAYRDSGEIVRVGGMFQDITDRKLAEIEARKNFEQLRLLSTELEIIIDSIPGLVFYKDKNNRFIRVNKYMCDVYKMSKKQLEGLNLNALHSKEQAQAYYEDDLQVIRSRQPKLNIDEPWETEAGIRWVSTSKIPYINETGEVVGIIGVSMDVTERKLAENELKRHRDHLEELVTERTADLEKSRELLVEAQTVARLGSWELDVVRDEITGSAEFYRLFGVGPEKLGHFQQFIDLLHVDDREHVQQAVAEALNRKVPYDTDYRIPAPDGGWRFLNARGQVFVDENGKTLRFVGTCMDITERKRSETELLIKDQVFEKAIVAQSITDDKATILHANPEFLRMWGYTAKEHVIGKNVGELLAERTEALRIIEALRVQGSWEGEFLAKRNDGKTFITRGFISSLFNARGDFIGYQSTNLDMTKDREAEASLKKASAELARSNKELELFAYVASHDLQEPLRMVSSYTQLLAQRYEGQLDAKAKKYIDYAVDGSVRMQRLINDLLTYSRISTRGKSLQPTDAHAVLGEAIRNLQAAIEESGALVTNDDLPTVRADTSQLLQIFQNLIANAIKFRGDTPPRIHVSAQDQGGEWLFSVQDNGIGIDREYADRLFVIFQRLHTRQEYPGTGIGLAVCKRIVERHGGRIWFESEPGKGSTFFFTISNN